jgi:hypothetical protein
MGPLGRVVGDTVYLHDMPGSNPDHRAERSLRHHLAAGRTVIVSGQQVSDDAFGLLADCWPHVWAMPGAVLLLHAAHISGTVHEADTADLIARIEDPTVRNGFRQHLAARRPDQARMVHEYYPVRVEDLAARGRIQMHGGPAVCQS